MKFGELFSGLALQFAIVGAVAGAVVSLLAGFIGGVDATDILLRCFISGLVMAGLGIGAHLILQSYTPEVFEAPDGGPASDEIPPDQESLPDGDLNESADIPDAGSELSTNAGRFEESLDSGTSNVGARRTKAKSGEILVEGVPLKNEPKLMAEAIQHLMDLDKD